VAKVGVALVRLCRLHTASLSWHSVCCQANRSLIKRVVIGVSGCRWFCLGRRTLELILGGTVVERRLTMVVSRRV